MLETDQMLEAEDNSDNSEEDNYDNLVDIQNSKLIELDLLLKL